MYGSLKYLILVDRIQGFRIRYRTVLNNVKCLYILYIVSITRLHKSMFVSQGEPGPIPPAVVGESDLHQPYSVRAALPVHHALCRHELAGGMEV